MERRVRHAPGRGRAGRREVNLPLGDEAEFGGELGGSGAVLDAELADSSVERLPIHRVKVSWHRRTRLVRVYATPGDPLVGMALLVPEERVPARCTRSGRAVRPYGVRFADASSAVFSCTHRLRRVSAETPRRPAIERSFAARFVSTG